MWQVLRAGKPENDFWYSNLLSSCFHILLLALTKEDVKCVSSCTWKGWELSHLLPFQCSIYEPVRANRTLPKKDEKNNTEGHIPVCFREIVEEAVTSAGGRRFISQCLRPQPDWACGLIKTSYSISWETLEFKTNSCSEQIYQRGFSDFINVKCN